MEYHKNQSQMLQEEIILFEQEKIRTNYYSWLTKDYYLDGE